VKIEDRFDLSATPERVWSVLNDIELISPFVPGFALKEVDGDVFRGAMRVKLGAMTVEYDTEIVIAERDDVTRTVRMDVAGREPRGGGKMRAAVTSQLEPAGDGTVVTLDTELELVGKIAQMGRGMIADVSATLIREFVGSLEANVLNAPHADGGEGAPAAEPMPSAAEAMPSVPPTPVDLSGAASRAVAKRLVPAMLAAVVLVWLLRRARPPS
jgi:carbon monoxide dehydrogenase subunit G